MVILMLIGIYIVGICHPHYSRWWFQTFFMFDPYLGKISKLTNYFSDGLKPPTSFRCQPSLFLFFVCVFVVFQGGVLVRGISIESTNQFWGT